MLSSCAILVLALSAFMVTQPVLVTKKQAMELSIDTNELKRQILGLTNIQPNRHFAHIASLNKAADFIEAEFNDVGYELQRQTYKVFGREVHNLSAFYGKSDSLPKPRLVIGAHYDVCEDLPGADDNGSGVVGLLQLARLLHEQGPVLPFEIELVAYTLEEPPFFRTDQMGSHMHALSLKKNEVDVLGMICLEMIGYFDDAKGSQDYPVGLLKAFYPNRGDFITVVGKLSNGGLLRKVKKGMKSNSDISVKSINSPAFVPGIDFSDHLNYWKFGFDAVMVNNTGFYRNHNYHTAQDTPEKLDYYKMGEVIKGVYGAVLNLR